MFHSIVFNHVFLPSLMASLVVLLILFTKLILKKQLTGEWHYYIWFLLLLKLLIPYNIQTNLSLYNHINIPILNTTQNTLSKYNISNAKIIDSTSFNNFNPNSEISKIQEPIIKSKNNVNLTPISVLSIIWATGALSILIYVLIINIKSYSSLKRNPLYKNKRLEKLLEQCKYKMKLKSAIAIYTTTKFPTVPSLWGILKPKIIIPISLESRLTDENLKYIIFHELSHYKRKDNLINLLITTLKIINWFNPLIWYGFYIMSEDCEIACDTMVLRHINSEESPKYGNTLISLYKLTSLQRDLLGITTLFKNKSHIKRRINMIALFKKKSTIWSIVIIIFIILVGTFAITGEKNQKTSDSSANVTKKSIASATENNVNKSSQNTTNNSQENDIAKATEGNSSNSNNTNNTNTDIKTGRTTTTSTNQSASKSNTNNANKTTNTNSPPQQSKPVQKSQSQPAQTTPVKEEVRQPVSASPQKYVNTTLGLSINFPSYWQGKYKVSENSDGLTVIFKSTSHPEEGGILFLIIKKSQYDNGEALDTISGAKKYITAKGVDYVIGGPTDIGFPPDNPEYSTYKQLTNQRSSVINTIQNIN